MFRALILIILLSVCLPASLLLAQTPVWQWASRAGSAAVDGSSSIAPDSLGNQYIACVVHADADFGSFNVTGFINLSFGCIVIAKLDADGNWLWAHAIQTEEEGCGGGSSITVSRSGRIYVTGDFMGFLRLGSYTYNAGESQCMFAGEIDSEGNWLWARFATGSTISAITTDSADNVYIAGRLTAAATFGSTVLQPLGNTSSFCAKLSSVGDWLWVRMAGGTTSQDMVFANVIKVDNQGSLCLTGHYRGSIDFGSFHLTALTSPDNVDSYVAKPDSLGNWIWAYSFGGNSMDCSNAMAIDNAGNIYISGDFAGTAFLGDFTLNSHGQSDIFLAKLDPTGNWLWAHSTGGSNPDGGIDLCYDGGSNIYLTGCYCGTVAFGNITLQGDTLSLSSHQIFVAKADLNGNWLWAANTRGYDLNRPVAIELDAADNILITGFFWYDCQFGNYLLVSAGYGDIFVAKLSNPVPVHDPVLPVAQFNHLSVFPNPFRDHTCVKFTLPDYEEAELRVYNLKGQLIGTFNPGMIAKGEHTFTWNGRDSEGTRCSAGIYLVNLRTRDGVRTQKAVLLR